MLPMVSFGQTEERRVKEEGKTYFVPHYFLQLQGGAATTVGEADFSDLFSPAAAFAADQIFPVVVLKTQKSLQLRLCCLLQ